MPGIVGIIGKGPRAKHEGDLKLMLDCMMHEPFYGSGTYVNESLGVYVGWTSHHDSFTDCLPATNGSKDVILVFAGEDFSAASEPRRKASSLVSRYEEKGVGFLKELNGWFSGVLIDLRTSTVVLFNDRYGMQRIYVHEGEQECVFGSEAKSLLRVRPALRRLDERGLGELISCSCVMEGRTIFPGISLLPGGSAWKWGKGNRVHRDAYFKPEEWEALPPVDARTFLEELSGTVTTVIPRYFREKGKVGMSLTGGLDSRMMMACLKPAPDEVPCYTFGGKKDMLDITIAREVAEVCGQRHSVVRLDPSFFAEFPQLAEKTIYITDGNLDVSNTHDMFFNRLARSIAPIRVTGKFGSEVIRDHTMFNAGEYQGTLFVPELKQFMNNAVGTLGKIKRGHPLSVAVFMDFPWREYNKIIIEESQSIFRTPYMDNDLVRLMYTAPPGLRSSNQPQRTIIRECNPRLSAIISDRGYGEQTNPLVAKLMELYYYVLFKIDYTYLYAMPNWLMPIDSLLLTLNGGKPLFGWSQKFENYRIWYRQELANYVKGILLDPRTLNRPYFDKHRLEFIVRAHTKGVRNYASEITKALSLELTHRLLIDR